MFKTKNHNPSFLFLFHQQTATGNAWLPDLSVVLVVQNHQIICGTVLSGQQ